jgi:hypothetical protein
MRHSTFRGVLRQGTLSTQAGVLRQGTLSTQAGVLGQGTLSTQAGVLGQGTLSTQAGVLGQGTLSTQARVLGQGNSVYSHVGYPRLGTPQLQSTAMAGQSRVPGGRVSEGTHAYTRGTHGVMGGTRVSDSSTASSFA